MSINGNLPNSPPPAALGALLPTSKYRLQRTQLRQEKLRRNGAFKNWREGLWDAILKEPVPRLIRMLVCDWAPKIIL